MWKYLLLPILFVLFLNIWKFYTPDVDAEIHQILQIFGQYCEANRKPENSMHEVFGREEEGTRFYFTKYKVLIVTQ